MTAFLLSVGGLVLSVIGFLIGKSLSESEKILSEKRRIYEAALRSLPAPNDAYPVSSTDRPSFQSAELTVLLLYASPMVAQAVGRYVSEFQRVSEVLQANSPPLDPNFKELAKAHNDLILEMRRDAFAWSVFGYRGPSRLRLAEDKEKKV